jgi:hypothetical protein
VVKERVEVYLYAHCVPSWHIKGGALLFTFPVHSVREDLFPEDFNLQHHCCENLKSKTDICRNQQISPSFNQLSKQSAVFNILFSYFFSKNSNGDNLYSNYTVRADLLSTINSYWEAIWKDAASRY